MEDISAVIKKIQKLLALSGSKNEFEASNAAAKAAQLMRDYELESADLDTAEEPQGPIQSEVFDGEDLGRRVRWRQTLASVLADTSGLKMWTSGPKTVMFGPAMKISATRYIFAYLVNEIDGAADREYRKNGLMAEPRAFKSEFRKGSCWRICGRLRELHKESKIEESSKISESTALVLVRRDAKLDAAYKGLGLRLQTMRSDRSRDTAAFRAGQAHGSSVDLGNARRPQLGAAPGKLRSGE